MLMYHRVKIVVDQNEKISKLVQKCENIYVMIIEDGLGVSPNLS